MTQVIAEQERYIIDFMDRWQQVGVTHVLVTTTQDANVCEPCYHANMNIIRLADVIKHREQCTSEGGCRCSFYPIAYSSTKL